MWRSGGGGEEDCPGWELVLSELERREEEERVDKDDVLMRWEGSPNNCKIFETKVVIKFRCEVKKTQAPGCC